MNSDSDFTIAQAQASPSAGAGIRETVGDSLSSLTSSGDSIMSTLKGTDGLVIVGALVLLGVMSLANRGGGKGAKDKIAKGTLAGGAEKTAARKKAIKQAQGRKHNQVALSVGTPRRDKKGKITGTGTLWLPDMQRGMAVCGGPGSGKSFFMNPIFQSAFAQGFPAIIYDFKYPDQTSVLIGEAIKHGYDVKIFAPGYPESEICNPLDFLDDENDALSARQIATVMNRNFALSANASEDKFFADAGDQLTLAILMLAKSLPLPDLLTASAILSLSDLPKRIQFAKEQGDRGKLPNDWQMSHWIYLAFSQLLQLQGSEKTIAGVVGTASKIFSRFLSPELVGAFCGKTTLPIVLEGKKLIVLGLDRRKREAIAPLVATMLHMIVTKNVTMKRKDPLILGLDELPTMYLPYLVQWLNENRSDGLCTILGFQNITQLEKAYSREISRSILGGCATKAFFNPQDPDSGQLFSQFLGEEELKLKQKSKNRGGGKGSTTTSEQRQKRWIVEAAEFNRFPTGQCVLVSPGHARKDETALPLKIKIKVPKRDIETQQWSEGKWAKIRERLCKASRQKFFSGDEAKDAVSQRLAIAEEYLPAPPKEEKGGGNGLGMPFVPPAHAPVQSSSNSTAKPMPKAAPKAPKSTLSNPKAKKGARTGNRFVTPEVLTQLHAAF